MRGHSSLQKSDERRKDRQMLFASDQCNQLRTRPPLGSHARRSLWQSHDLEMLDRKHLVDSCTSIAISADRPDISVGRSGTCGSVLRAVVPAPARQEWALCHASVEGEGVRRPLRAHVLGRTAW